MCDWRITPRNGRTTPIIATGHQPWLWHPGVLAKDLAVDAFAAHAHATTLHVVVEHNAIEPLSIDVPTRRVDTLGTRRLTLDTHAAAATLPPNRLPALDPQRVADRLTDDAEASSDLPMIHERLHAIARAYLAVGPRQHLAAQTAAVLRELKRPYLSQPQATLSTSAVVTQHFVDRLLADPLRCVRCYNRAALAYPQAGIRPLYVGRDVVESPLWAQGRAASVPVYIDLGDSRRPQLFTQHETIDLAGPDALQALRPRAITLSALMRSEHCDLFIHGRGGSVYDRVTERWWRDWAGEPLSPKVLVSADVFLPFDAPTATRDELAQAVWFDHHLPHNLDRYTAAVDDAEAAWRREKHELLDHMNDDRDKRRRSRSFQRLHAINAELARHHRDRLDQVRADAERARLGVDNAAIARRRDWCFALYPQAELRDLREAIGEDANNAIAD